MIEAYFDLLGSLTGSTISEKTKTAFYNMTVSLFDHEAGQVFETLCHDKGKTGFVFHDNIIHVMLNEVEAVVKRIASGPNRNFS